MPIGVSLQLFEGATPRASLTGIQALWYDETQLGAASRIVGRSSTVSTDGSGYINLDISNVTGLTVGDYGFLSLYKLDGTDHKDSLIFSGKVQTSTITSGDVLTLATPQAAAWVRNPSWPAMPNLTGLQKFAGLHAVYPDSNFCALSAEGDFTVDWGDGTSTVNVSSGVTAYYNFDFNAAGLAGTDAPVTLTDTGDLITRTAHGYTDGMTVRFYNIVSTTGLTAASAYYVVNASANNFQVSLTPGGSAIALTTDGTATLLPYKLAMVTVVPNGGNLTKLDLHLKHNQSSLQAYTSGFLDIAISGSLLTDLRLGVTTPGSTAQTIRCSALERFNLVASNLKQLEYLFLNCYALQEVVDLATSSDAASTQACTFQDTGDTVTANSHGLINGQSVIFSSIASTTGITVGTRYFVVGAATNTFQVATTYGGTAINLVTDGSGNVVCGTNFSIMFYNCTSLTTIPLINTAAGTNFSIMFASCSSLTTIPLINTAAGTNFSSMFASCSSLTTIPLINTAAGTNFSSMFYNCYSLSTIPLINTAAGTDFSGMLVNCSSLTTIPLINTAAGTNFSSMFASCSSLTTIPLINTAAGTNFSIMFASCSSLTTIPLINTAAGTNFSSMFYNCYSLSTIPLINTAAGTDFSGMLVNCTSLTTIPLINTAAGTNFSSMFYGCTSLTTIPLINTAAGTDFSSMFTGCDSLSSAALSGTPQSISYTGCKLSGAALDAIYTALPTVTAKTITVTNNWGTATDTPSIATGKGWTVTG